MPRHPLLLLCAIVGPASAQRPIPKLTAAPIMWVSPAVARVQVPGNLIRGPHGVMVAPRWFQDSSIAFFSLDGRVDSVPRRGAGGLISPGGYTGWWLGDSLWLTTGITFSVFGPDLRLARLGHEPEDLRYPLKDQWRFTAGLTTTFALYPDGSRLMQVWHLYRPSLGSLDPARLPDGSYVRADAQWKLQREVAHIPANPECTAVGHDGKPVFLSHCAVTRSHTSANGRWIAMAFVVHDKPGFDIVSLTGYGDTAFHRHFAFPAVPIQRQAWQVYLDDLRTRLDPGVLDTLTISRDRRPFREIVAGDDGTVWVDIAPALEPHRWLVLDARGNPIGQMSMPNLMTLSAASRDTIWGLIQEPSGPMSGVLVAEVRRDPVRYPVDLDLRNFEFPAYRIPALAVTRRGTLIAAYDRRPSLVDLPGNIALVVRRSRDGGKTWLSQVAVRQAAAPAGFGDPSLLVDRLTGRIFLFHAASMRQGFFGSATGNREDDPNVLQADYSWSDDDGVTWQHRRITGQIKQATWGGLFAASGAGIQLVRGPHRGRLVQQYVVRFNGANFGASAFSDDHGATWQMGALIGPGIDENKAVELADGTLLLNSRGKPTRKSAISSDGGQSWHDLRDELGLIDPGNNGAIVRFDADAPPRRDRAHWLLFSNTESRERRENLTLKISCDDGRTWPFRKVIDPTGAGYSTLAILPGGDVGLLYERGDYQAISFVRIPSREVTSRCH